MRARWLPDACVRCKALLCKLVRGHNVDAVLSDLTRREEHCSSGTRCCALLRFLLEWAHALRRTPGLVDGHSLSPPQANINKPRSSCAKARAQAQKWAGDAGQVWRTGLWRGQSCSALPVLAAARCWGRVWSTDSRKALPGLKWGTRLEGTCTASPLRGLRPTRGGR